jgi:hypothetical protein
MFRDDERRPDDPDRSNDRSDRANRELDAFAQSLDLPRGLEREQVDGYWLRGSEVRTLATVGAFRAVPRCDLERHSAARSREIDRLRQGGLLATTPYKIGGRRLTIVTLTREGLALLEGHRRDGRLDERQQFYAGVARPSELAHDSRLFEAYVQTRDRLRGESCNIRRVLLEHDLKREYQRFLQEPNRGRRRSTGVPRRDPDAIARWAKERDLPMIDGSVRFPDLRVEYDRPDGTLAREDLEIVTENYRGAHAAATAAAGFNCHRHASTRVGGSRSSSKGGRSRDERLAEEMLR